MTPSDRPSWVAIGTSVRGSAHVRAGRASEDAYAHSGGGSVAIAAVADGHGSERCFRSAVGARLATRIGLDVLRDTARTADPARLEDELRLTTSVELIRRWRGAVADHHAAHPFDEDEQALCVPDPDGGGALRSEIDEIELAYGTTFIGLLVTDELAAGMQVGDGDTAVVDGGGVVHLPVPPDPESVGNVTTSMAGASADHDVRTWVQRFGTSRPSLAWLSTDGLGGAYESADWHEEVGEQLRTEHAAHGVAGIASKLEGWLAAPAEVAGDDATMVIVLPTGPSGGSGPLEERPSATPQ